MMANFHLSRYVGFEVKLSLILYSTLGNSKTKRTTKILHISNFVYDSGVARNPFLFNFFSFCFSKIKPFHFKLEFLFILLFVLFSQNESFSFQINPFHYSFFTNENLFILVFKLFANWIKHWRDAINMKAFRIKAPFFAFST